MCKSVDLHVCNISDKFRSGARSHSLLIDVFCQRTCTCSGYRQPCHELEPTVLVDFPLWQGISPEWLSLPAPNGGVLQLWIHNEIREGERRAFVADALPMQLQHGARHLHCACRGC